MTICDKACNALIALFFVVVIAGCASHAVSKLTLESPQSGEMADQNLRCRGVQSVSIGDELTHAPFAFTLFADTEGDHLNFLIAGTEGVPGADNHFNISTKPQIDGVLRTRKIEDKSDADNWDIYVQYASWADSVHLMIDKTSGDLKFTEQRGLNPIRTTRVEATCKPFRQ
jgi:hypothetical protein